MGPCLWGWYQSLFNDPTSTTSIAALRIQACKLGGTSPWQTTSIQTLAADSRQDLMCTVHPSRILSKCNSYARQCYDISSRVCVLTAFLRFYTHWHKTLSRRLINRTQVSGLIIPSPIHLRTALWSFLVQNRISPDLGFALEVITYCASRSLVRVGWA